METMARGEPTRDDERSEINANKHGSFRCSRAGVEVVFPAGGFEIKAPWSEAHVRVPALPSQKCSKMVDYRHHRVRPPIWQPRISDYGVASQTFGICRIGTSKWQTSAYCTVQTSSRQSKPSQPLQIVISAFRKSFHDRGRAGAASQGACTSSRRSVQNLFRTAEGCAETATFAFTPLVGAPLTTMTAADCKS